MRSSGVAIPVTPTSPTRSRRRSSGRSTSWWLSTAAINRPCGDSGAEPYRLALLRAFDAASGAAADVPDPYYGDDGTFDECREMIASVCAGLVASLAASWDSLWSASPNGAPFG